MQDELTFYWPYFYYLPNRIFPSLLFSTLAKYFIGAKIANYSDWDVRRPLWGERFW